MTKTRIAGNYQITRIYTDKSRATEIVRVNITKSEAQAHCYRQRTEPNEAYTDYYGFTAERRMEVAN